MKRIALLVLMSALVLVGSDASAKTRVCGSGGRFLNLEAIGLTQSGKLICFSERRPSRAREIGTVTGLAMGETLVGIDFRPSNGKLYGVGNMGGIYVIDPLTAAVVPGAMPVTLATRLMGTSFGVDFNPVPDRLRIVSDAGQNLRVNADTGADVVMGGDMPLMMVGGMGTALGVTAAAYTNNDPDLATGTVLYDIGTMSMTPQLLIQAPPNAGMLNTVGALGVDIGMESGFDVFSQLREGKTQLLKALAVLRVGAQSQLFLVDLDTGRLRLRGAFDTDSLLIGLAIPLVQGR